MAYMKATLVTLIILALAGPACAAQPTLIQPFASPLPVHPSRTPSALATPLPARPANARYDIGQPTLSELYVAPTGSDANSGLTPDAPLQTLTAAWAQLPMTTSTTGYRINLLPGTYPCEPAEPDNCQNYFSDRYGSYAYPIILRASGGPGTTFVRGGMNIKSVRYLYLLDLTLIGGDPLPLNSAGNDLLHLEATQYVLIRGLNVQGPACDNDQCNNLQEVFKVNQAQYLYVENSRFSGAWHTVVDFFVVQYGHFIGNEMHTAGQWCMYIKGGTAYYTIDSNTFHDCWLGFQAGQSANLAVMIPPWVHYEVYDIKFTNNLLHDLPGTGVSVAGGYNVLVAYNTLYRVATDAVTGFSAFQMVFGERNCTPINEIPGVTANCPLFTGLGAWGPTAEDPSQPAIPNQNVYVYNNILYNPSPSQTLYATLNILGPIPRPAGFANVPDPAYTDDHLVFKGNVLWDGPNDHPLGVGDVACLPDNPTCNETLIRADNQVNTQEPVLVSPPCGDYRLNGALSALTTTVAIPDFPAWGTFTPAVPAGTLANPVGTDFSGVPRTALNPPGAFFTQTTAYGCQSVYLPLSKR